MLNYVIPTTCLVHVAKLVLQNKRVKRFWILNGQILIKIAQISINGKITLWIQELSWINRFDSFCDSTKPLELGCVWIPMIKWLFSLNILPVIGLTMVLWQRILFVPYPSHDQILFFVFFFFFFFLVCQKARVNYYF